MSKDGNPTHPKTNNNNSSCQTLNHTAKTENSDQIHRKMKVVAAYLLALLGGNTSPSGEDLKTILGSVGADVDKIKLLLKEVEGKDITELIEGKFLLGKPKFKKLENGRYKCVETGHELPADARESYAQTKHCRLGLIDSALARNKPPLNMFNQDPNCRSKLVCKLTGHTVNKIEEHIWKHINGLEKEEAGAGKDEEAGVGKEEEMDYLEVVDSEGKPVYGAEKKKKKKKKSKKKKAEEKDVSEIISEVRDPEEKENESEEDEFWIPPVGDRWDFDDGKDRWGSDLESDVDPEDDDDEIEADATIEESNEAQELSKRTKRMSIEIEPSDLASQEKKKKKKKTEST